MSSSTSSNTSPSGSTTLQSKSRADYECSQANIQGALIGAAGGGILSAVLHNYSMKTCKTLQ